MFLGHFAVAFAAKRPAPRASLGVLFAAAQLPDLLWPVFVLRGWEQVRIVPGDTAVTPLQFVSYPISHSLVADIGWGVLAGALYFAWRRDRGGAITVGLLVVSHWVLDVIAHRPDMPLYPGGAQIGLGLWNSIPATVLVESALLLTGVTIYLSATRPRDATGKWLLLSLVLVLVVSYAASLLGPPPPSARAVAWTALAIWILVAWAWWADRHRAADLDA